ncbi:MAG TPA: CHASE3 domain-containing protein, partial [Solirubrobacteraceae bacterium]|nr:CHASE3 domain-containing protein [Solirubrobacteraceae bacterium]
MRSRGGLVTGVLVAVATGAVAVALGVALLLTHIVDLRSSANNSLRTGTYLDATLNVERLVVDAETGLRGYVITTDRGFLAPERSAAAAMPGAAAALQRAAASDGAFETQAARLVSSARFYLDTYVPQVIREVSTNPALARSVAT